MMNNLKKMMKPELRKGYSLPFKRTVAEMYTTTALSGAEIGKLFGCHKSQVYYWSTQLFQGLLDERFAVAFSTRPHQNVGANAAVLRLSK